MTDRIEDLPASDSELASEERELSASGIRAPQTDPEDPEDPEDAGSPSPRDPEE